MTIMTSTRLALMAKITVTGLFFILLCIPMMIRRPQSGRVAPVPRQGNLANDISANPTNSDNAQSTPEADQEEPSSMPSARPSLRPTPRPFQLPSNPAHIFMPGNITVFENGLRLSNGLQSRLIATSGSRVRFADGSKSEEKFHKRPDGAAVFAVPDGEGWVYASNSESTSNGGVGAIWFDGEGNAIDYYTILEGTVRNCQGGKTPWNTWVSCEENDEDGQCWETDPFGYRKARETYLGGSGGNYEAMACDDRNMSDIHFFITEDKVKGAVRRFTPNPEIVKDYLNGDSDPWEILGSPGKVEYLVLSPRVPGGSTGTYSWSPYLDEGRRSADLHYRKSEGMDIQGDELYFVSSSQKEVFVLDLDRFTYKKMSTESNDFRGQPDGLKTDGSLMYFSEETKSNYNAGVFCRDLRSGEVFTILESNNDEAWGDACGLALDPSRTRLYIAYQKEGKVFEITRKDGLSFDGDTFDLRHHIRDN